MSIDRFRLTISQEAIDDLARRVKQTRWPENIFGKSWDPGVPVDYLKKTADYWVDSFDWRTQERLINSYDQYTSTLDGQVIHFFHVRSENRNALPLLLLHGWPSSSIEYQKIIDPLRESFHLVIPTIPGFGLSSPVRDIGWQSPRTAKALALLMGQLGYERYGAHGSDIGSDVLSELAKIDGEHLVGAHHATDTHTLVLSVTLFMGGGDPSENNLLSEEQKRRIKEIQAEWKEDMGYLQIQSTKPSTLGYGLHDSPVVQLAWQVEKYKTWTNPSSKLPEEKIDIDQMLTNISLYWYTGAGAASANYIYQNMRAYRDWSAGSKVPTGQAVFGAESFARPLLDPERRIGHWSEFTEGRHFPAMEVPELLIGDLRKFFDT